MAGLLAGCGGTASPEQMEAISKLQDLGARVNVKRGGYEVDLKQTAVTDRDLAHLQKIADLKSVDLKGTRITDGGLEYLKSIPSLEMVVLSGTAVTPEGVAGLRKSIPNTDVVR